MVRVSYIDTALWTAADYERILSTLSQERRARAERYQSERDRYLSAGASYLLDCALKEMGKCEREAQYTFNEHAKPYMGGVYFNLSHSGTVSALAVGDHEVGVDVQKLGPVTDRLIERVCTESEQKLIKESGDGERAFFRLWTAKESAGKFLGTGLSEPKAFEIDLKYGRVTLRGETLKAVLKEYPLDGYALFACANEPFESELQQIKL